MRRNNFRRHEAGLLVGLHHIGRGIPEVLLHFIEPYATGGLRVIAQAAPQHIEYPVALKFPLPEDPLGLRGSKDTPFPRPVSKTFGGQGSVDLKAFSSSQSECRNCAAHVLRIAPQEQARVAASPKLPVERIPHRLTQKVFITVVMPRRGRLV